MAFFYGNNSANRIIGGAEFDWIYGRAGDDFIAGGANSDVLFGEAGNDTVKGEAGNDFIWGSAGTFNGAGNDVIDGGAGIDTVYYSNQGVLRGVTADLGAGVVRSSAGSNRLIGVENFWGSKRADTVVGSARGETVWGDGGDDRIDGRAGDDWLWGDAGNDTLVGGVGNDTFFGGSGAGRMSGGAGVDHYVFGAESLGARDTITGHAAGETLNLLGIDANAGTAADNAFRFVGGGAFTGAGQLRAVATAGGLLVQGSTDGDAAAEFELFLAGVARVNATDFAL